MTDEQASMGMALVVSMPFGEDHGSKTKSNIMVAVRLKLRCRPPTTLEAA